MSITLNLKPEVEASLLERSEQLGLSPERYVESILEEPHMLNRATYISDPKARAKAFMDWASTPRRYTEPLSNEAISRESIYSDHD